MTRHLNDADLAAAVAGTLVDAEAAAHLANCVVCRRAIADLTEAIDRRRSALDAEAPDWDRHLEAILDRLPASPRHRTRRWLGPLLAAAASLVLAVGTGVLVNHRAPKPMPTPVPGPSVEEILAETDSLLADDSIPGFEAVTDLSDENLNTLFSTDNS